MYFSLRNTRAIFLTLITLFATITGSTAFAANQQNRATNHSATELDERFDTSFAIEYSGSCVSGGCHEADTQLLEEHADSFMTHVMVKCNACHGTHTTDDVGQEKPDLTGYYPGIGPSGYVVGDDRCIACHTATLDNPAHPESDKACVACHLPHRFSTNISRRLR